jgi:endonuclease/exonuclease/phosphatase (EEP) superfamily protein YafD
VAATATAGALGSLGHLAWWLELFSHFRPQYALLLAGGAVVLLALGRPAAGLAALAFAFANALPLAHYLGPPREAPEAPEAAQGLRAVLINPWFRNEDHQRVLDYVGALDPDLAIFLEVTPAWHDALRSLARLPYQARAGELFVASRQPLADLRALPLAGGSAMAVAFTLDVGGTAVSVIGAHANWPLGPTIAASRDRELTELAAIARSARPPVLLLGDLNATAFSPVFARLLTASGLGDCAAGRGFNPTWPTLFPPLFMQIDHCLAGPGLAVRRLRTGPYVGSDHYPLEVEVTLSPPPAGGGLTASAARPTSRR